MQRNGLLLVIAVLLTVIVVGLLKWPEFRAPFCEIVGAANSTSSRPSSPSTISATTNSALNSSASSSSLAPPVTNSPDSTRPSPPCPPEFILNIPKEYKELVIQVGVHQAFVGPRKPGSFIIGFEPMLSNINAGQLEGVANTKIVPAAVTEHSGIATFHILTGDASHSLKTPSRDYMKTGRTIMVPTVTLESVLVCITDPRFAVIDFLMCDAQGADFNVVKSAGKELKRFRFVKLEVEAVTGKGNIFYINSGNQKAEVVKYMASMGFQQLHPDVRDCNGAVLPDCEEENVEFNNTML